MSLSGGYDFSQLYHSSLVSFSPGSTFIATVHGRRLIVRSTASLSIVRTFQCLNISTSTPTPTPTASSSRQPDTHVALIDQLLWSSDSLYLLAFSSKAATAWVFGLTEEGNGGGGEVARLGGEGIEGLVRVEWGRGSSGRDVIAWSDHGLRLTIWDLSTGNASYIQYPKSHSNCHSFSPDSRYLAVVERHSSKDHVGIYDTRAQYALLRHFSLKTIDAQGILWSPCGKYIAVYDAMITYALYVHSPLGPVLTTFTPSSPSFSPTSTAEDPGLGIRCASWAPGGRWIALGGWDGKVRVVESEGGRCVATMSWAGRVVEKDATVWREPSGWLRETRGRGIVQFDRSPLSSTLPNVRPDLGRYPPRSGISQLSFDAEATLLFIRLHTQPNVVHIHTFLPTPTSSSPDITHLAALVFAEPVRTARCCPGKRKVAISTRGGGVYFWDGDEGWVEDVTTSTGDEHEARGGLMEGVGIPTRTDFIATEAIWSPDGASVAIIDRPHSQFCVLYEPDLPNVDQDQSDMSRRWDGGDEGLTHVSEEEEGEEEDRSVLQSLAEVRALWRPSRMGVVGA